MYFVRPPLPSGKYSWYCYRLKQPRGHGETRMIMWMKNANDCIGIEPTTFQIIALSLASFCGRLWLFSLPVAQNLVTEMTNRQWHSDHSDGYIKAYSKVSKGLNCDSNFTKELHRNTKFEILTAVMTAIQEFRCSILRQVLVRYGNISTSLEQPCFLQYQNVRGINFLYFGFLFYVCGRKN